ncbi:hypothetical protein J4228_04795 [Candidatus Woesearchaeota archaeon]|nr:hypothetical protein [Candidatus Woesearchaeota archaeon]
MGWLFGKKKKAVPKVPFPEGKMIDERALRFPTSFSTERVIEPERIKEAAGMKESLPVPELSPKPVMPAIPSSFKREVKQPLSFPPRSTLGPLYINVEVYQQVLGRLEDLKKEFTILNEKNRSLETSEFNEEGHFEKMQRSVKVLHDRLLQIDKTLFKAQGE